MGEVYLAVRNGPSGFQKRVALKLLLAHVGEDSQSMAMFHDEARLASKLEHPHIIPVIDFGQLNGRYFMAMPLVEGVSLHQFGRALLKQQTFIPLPLFRLIARGVCDGLGFAHRAKDDAGNPLRLVHRDISPSNVMVSTTGGVFVADFGIAKAVVNQHRTRTGQIRGKFAYMSPEHMLGLPVDARTDVFSTCVMLYELLTGRNPFKRETEAATIEAVQTDAILPPRELRADVTPAIEAAILKGMARLPDQRFETMEALRDALLDGPIAQPHELGDTVSRTCPEHLAKLNQTPLGPPEGELGGQTLSVGMPAIDVTEPSSRVRPRKPVATLVQGLLIGLGVGLLGLLGVIAFTLLNRPPPAPTPVAVVTPSPPPVLPSPPPVEPSSKPEEVPVMPVDAGLAVTVDAGVAPVAKGRGYVSADATPWANVFVDGASLGPTPVVRHQLSQGAHDVVFRFSNGTVLQKRVQVGRATTTTVLADGTRKTLQLKVSK